MGTSKKNIANKTSASPTPSSSSPLPLSAPLTHPYNFQPLSSNPVLDYNPFGPLDSSLAPPLTSQEPLVANPSSSAPLLPPWTLLPSFLSPLLFP